MIRLRRFGAFSLLILLLCGLSAKAVRAQDAVSPFERFGFKEDSLYQGRTKSRAIGVNTAPPIRWRGLSVSAQSDVLQVYTDNVFSTQDDQKSDFALRVEPRLSVKQARGRHQFSLDLSGKMDRYIEQSDESHLDYSARFRTRLEARRSLILPFEFGYERAHVDRTRQRGGTFESISDEPLHNDRLYAQGGLRYKPNRLGVSVMGAVEQRRYEDGVSRQGGAIIQRDGDYDRYGLEARLSYDTTISLTPFVEARYVRDKFIRSDYDETALDFTGTNRDHDKRRLRAGVSFDYKGLATGLIAAGQESFSYEQSDIEDSDALSLAASARFTLDPRWRLSVSASALEAQDSLVKAGLEKRRFSALFEYELKQDLFAHVDALYMRDEFTSIVRTDHSYELGGGLDYILTPRVSLGATYLYRGRASDAQGSDLDAHSVMVRVRGSI